MIDPALQELLNEPLGSPELQKKCSAAYAPPEACAMARRVSKTFLPAGKRPSAGPEVRERKAAFYEKQADLEDAVEAAGGARGSVAPRG